MSKAESQMVGYIPKASAKPASPLQTLSTKRNWDRLQIIGSTKQLQHHVHNVPIDAKSKARYFKALAEMEHNLLVTIDIQWKKAKVLARKAVEAEFLDYPPSIRMSFMEGSLDFSSRALTLEPVKVSFL